MFKFKSFDKSKIEEYGGQMKELISTYGFRHFLFDKCFEPEFKIKKPEYELFLLCLISRKPLMTKYFYKTCMLV